MKRNEVRKREVKIKEKDKQNDERKGRKYKEKTRG